MTPGVEKRREALEGCVGLAQCHGSSDNLTSVSLGTAVPAPSVLRPSVSDIHRWFAAASSDSGQAAGGAVTTCAEYETAQG